MRNRILAVAPLFVLLASIGRADDDSAALLPAEQEFARGDWDKAAKSLRQIAPKLKSSARRAAAFKMLGLAEIERKQFTEAEAAFLQALSANPLIDVDPNEDPPKAVALFRSVRDRLDGQLAVSTDRADTRLFVDGVDQGRLPKVVTVKIGKRRVRVATDDGSHVGEVENVVVSVGRVNRVVVKLSPRFALLSVTGPRGASVTVDAVRVGETPLVRHRVSPASHVVEVMREGFVSKRFTWNAAAGDEKTFDGTLQSRVKIVDPLIARTLAGPSNARKVTRTLAFVSLGVGAAAAIVGAILYWSPTAPEKSTMLAAEYEKEKSSYTSTLNAGIVMMIAGGGLVASSGILFMVQRELGFREKKAGSASRGTGVSVAFRF